MYTVTMENLISVLTATVLLSASPVDASRFPDWLVTKIDMKSSLKDTGGTLIFTNGLIGRQFSLTPGFTTIDFFFVEKQSSLLRALSPEATIRLDGTKYNVGGLLADIPRAYLNRTALSMAMKNDPAAFQYAGFTPHEPEAPFPYTPRRGAPQDITWPPKGIRLDVKFTAPATASVEHQGVAVTVHYELYDGIPLMSKWVSVEDNSVRNKAVAVSVESVEELHLNWQWSDQGYKWLYIETDEPHGTTVAWGIDPAASKMPGSFEPFVNCSYQVPIAVPLSSSGFVSFRVHELVVGSGDTERLGLSHHRMTRLLAPHTQENPVFFHMTQSTSAAVRKAIDQMAEVGFEMMIYSFGSGFNMESTDEAYVKRTASDIAYANSKGIEVGGYDLIALTRGVQADWMAVNAAGESVGSACFASGWYDELRNKTLSFMSRTNLTMVETDGPYGGYACSSTTHSHHTGESDSVYWQNKLQGDYYRLLRTKNVYVNQPDNYFYQGGSRTGMGYNENQYSLPRWQDISVSRQGMFDDTFIRIPTQGWMFVPLVVYHGGGSAAMFEPLSDHLPEYNFALGQYLGAGVAACYRGYRLYDTDQTKALVKNWVDFYKKYRDIVTSDIVHVRRADMQSVDSYMHVNPFLKNRALAMVFNPTEQPVKVTLTLPLYYTGLTTMATVAEKGLKPMKYGLERDYSIEVPIALEPLGITWFLIQ